MDAAREQSRQGVRVTIVGALVNVLLSGGKYAVGRLSGSRALVADAVHSLSDLFTDAVVLVGLRLGRAGPDDRHHFGHGRVETLASVVVGIALLAAAVGIGYHAALGIYAHDQRPPAWPAVVAAGVSILAKELLYHYTVRVGRRINSPALTANAWHHRSDALSSVAVLFGVAAAQIDPRWAVLDAYAALLVSVLVAKVGLDTMWRALREMTDAAPRPEVLDGIRRTVTQTPEVLEAHDLKVRTCGGTHMIQVHVVVDGEMSVSRGHAIAKEVERRLLTEVAHVSHVIVHVDPASDEPEQ